jgi:hypothetical protein
MAWIGVDLDGTLAEWGTAESPMDVLTIGRPIPAMVERVKGWLAELKDVRIFTARAGPATIAECLDALEFDAEGCDNPQQVWHDLQVGLIEAWCVEHLGQKLPITATKDFHMYELWDDRCVPVVTNTGRSVSELLVERFAKTDPR